jgi:hypothetical protein
MFRFAIVLLGCSSLTDDCRVIRYADIDSVNNVSCVVGEITVTGMVCFGMPASCEATFDTRAHFAVASREICQAADQASSTGCASDPVTFRCRADKMPIGRFPVAGGKTLVIETGPKCRLE